MSARSRMRRRMALVQCIAWILMLALSYEVSACPPGMDTGMEMPTPTPVAQAEAAEIGQTRGATGMECPFGGSMDEEGRPHCPLAVGGVGTCGTNIPTPSRLEAKYPPESFGSTHAASAPGWRADYSAEVQLPPPRS